MRKRVKCCRTGQIEALNASNQQTVIKVEGIGNMCHGKSFVMQDIRDHMLSAVLPVMRTCKRKFMYNTQPQVPV